MSTDELDTKSDRELDEIFAVEVAGWSKHPAMGEWCWLVGGTTSVYRAGVAYFSSTADEAARWLEKSDIFPIIRRPWHKMTERVWEVEFDTNPLVRAHAPTFARAVVIALIRARRAGI